MDTESVWGRVEVDFSCPVAIAPLDKARAANQLSIVLPNFELKLDAESCGYDKAQTISFRVPMNVPAGARILGYSQVLSLGIIRTAGTRVSIIADMNGTLNTLQYEFETSSGAPLGGSSISKFWRTFSPQGLELGAELGYLPDVTPYNATITVVVQRRTKTDSVICSIDVVDVIAHMSTS